MRNDARPSARWAGLEALGVCFLVGCSSSAGPADAAKDAAPAPALDAGWGDGAADDAPSDVQDGGTSTADGRTRAGYGEPCTVGNDATCADGFICLEGPSGGTVGFCTKTCPSTSSAVCAGTPPGTAAYCVVTNVNLQGDKGCAFVCRAGSRTYACPGALKCSTTDDPPGSGQYLCLP